jgi:hypothetical protein
MKYLRGFYKVMKVLVLLSVSACTTVTIDQVRLQASGLISGESVVVLGRRSGSDYETEPELISCVGKNLAQGENAINVIPEAEFIDSLYPWFEVRTAPTQVADLHRLLGYEKISQIIDDYKVHYIIWIDGNTETTRSSGSISCSLGGTGISCFGFGTWDKKASYEASVWDYQTKQQIGKVRSMAEGTSYVPAVVVPIPIIAPVQGDACEAMALQLQSFFNNKSVVVE